MRNGRIRLNLYRQLNPLQSIVCVAIQAINDIRAFYPNKYSRADPLPSMSEHISHCDASHSAIHVAHKCRGVIQISILLDCWFASFCRGSFAEFPAHWIHMACAIYKTLTSDSCSLSLYLLCAFIDSGTADTKNSNKWLGHIIYCTFIKCQRDFYRHSFAWPRTALRRSCCVRMYGCRTSK